MAIDSSAVVISIVGNSNESNLILNSSSSNVNDENGVDQAFKDSTNAHLAVLDLSVNGLKQSVVALQSRDTLFDLSMASLVAKDVSFATLIATNVASDISLALRVTVGENMDIAQNARLVRQDTLIASLNSQVTSLKNALNATYPIPADSVYSAGSSHTAYNTIMTPIVELNKIITIL